MRRALTLLFLASISAVARPATADPAITLVSLPSPASETAQHPTLATDRQGRTWLGWVETDGGIPAFYCSELGGPGGWGAKVLVAADDFGQRPILTATPGGHLAAAFSLKGNRFVWTQSRDGGRDWEPSVRHDGGDGAVATVLQNHSLLAAWPSLDDAPRVAVQYLTGPYAAAAPYLLSREGAIGSIQLQPLLDGGAEVMYATHLGSTAIHFARLHRRHWMNGRVLSAPQPAKPHEGSGPFEERFDLDGGRVEVAWLEPSGAWASSSPDAGARFAAPVRLDFSSRPFFNLDVALLHDSAAMVIFRSASGLYLQRVDPSGVPGIASLLTDEASAEWTRTSSVGSARIALALDFAGSADHASLVAAVASRPSGGITTFLVDVPEAALLAAAAEACHCSPTAQQLQGYSVRGTVVKLDLASRQLTLNLDPAPGADRSDAGRMADF
jgi:hypothetical protein